MAPWHALRPALSMMALTIFRGPTTVQARANSGVACTRWLVRDASRFAARECPTPLVLLRTPGITWSSAPAETEDVWSAWADMFAQRGYTTVEVDITVAGQKGMEADSADASAGANLDDPSAGITGAIKAASSELNSQLRLLNIPFAPVIIASGPGCLVAQAYVSDYRASGLVLVAPPPDADPRGASEKSWAWPRFSYEPQFPIFLVGEQGQEEALRTSRVGAAEKDGLRRGGKGVSTGSIKDGVRGDKTRYEVERWMDRCGF